MPRPAYTWAVPLHFTVYGHPPNARRLPGLCRGVCGRYPGGRRYWRFSLEELLAN